MKTNEVGMESACKTSAWNTAQTRIGNEYTMNLYTKEKKRRKCRETETPATCEIIGVQFTASCPRSYARKKRKEITRAWMCETDETERWKELLRSLCRDSQVNVSDSLGGRAIAPNDGKEEISFPYFFVGLRLARRSFVPSRTPDSYMHKRVHTHFSQLQRTRTSTCKWKLGFPVQRATGIRHALRMITAFAAVAAWRKEDFET